MKWANSVSLSHGSWLGRRGPCREAGFPGGLWLVSSSQVESWRASQLSGRIVSTGQIACSKVHRQILGVVEIHRKILGAQIFWRHLRNSLVLLGNGLSGCHVLLQERAFVPWNRGTGIFPAQTHLAAILISCSYSCSCEQLKKVIFLYLKYRTHLNFPAD